MADLFPLPESVTATPPTISEADLHSDYLRTEGDGAVIGCDAADEPRFTRSVAAVLALAGAVGHAATRAEREIKLMPVRQQRSEVM